MGLFRKDRKPSNVFVLGTGRCGTVTLIRACDHLDNFTAGHETCAGRVGNDRFDYPAHHIEADNRLSWFLGELGRRFGTEPLYVHLRRDPEQVARSFAARWDRDYRANMIRAFAHGLVMRSKDWPADSQLDVCRFYVQTVSANIEHFISDKPQRMTVWLEEPGTWLPDLWERISGSGDLQAALAEFEVQHNAS